MKGGLIMVNLWLSGYIVAGIHDAVTRSCCGGHLFGSSSVLLFARVIPAVVVLLPSAVVLFMKPALMLIGLGRFPLIVFHLIVFHLIIFHALSLIPLSDAVFSF